jgi:hypothetical protein
MSISFLSVFGVGLLGDCACAAPATPNVVAVSAFPLSYPQRWRTSCALGPLPRWITRGNRYQIAPMDLGESAKYLQHHLALAGRKGQCLQTAVAGLHNPGLGLPRNHNGQRTAPEASLS